MPRLHHRIIRAYLSQAEKKFSLDNIEAARKKFENASKNTVKVSIKSVKDKTIGSDSGNIKVRIYRNNLSENRPALVYFHGGGFVLGSVNSHDAVCRYLCKYTTDVVVSVEYHLAPEYKHPAPINDGQEVLKWIADNGRAEGIDTSKIILVGDSAGGHIALGLAIDRKMRDELRGLVLIYPTLDPSLSSPSVQQYATGHFLTSSILRQFWELYLGDGHQEWPIPSNKLDHLPPTLVIGAEKDVLRDEGVEFVEYLRSLGKDIEYECYPDMLHGFVQFPRIASKKVQAFKRIALFLDRVTG